MALSEKNFYWFCGISVYMIIIVTASPAKRRAIIVNQTDFPANSSQINSVCWTEDVAYNTGDIVPGSGLCEQCVCNAPNIVCSAINCEIKSSCKIIQKENQCCPEFLCDCEYNDRIYHNGEKVDTTDTPCRVCYCKGGDVMCSTVGCYERDDCEGVMVPGTCCPKYDHCPPLDENNKNVKVTQIRTDTITARAGSRGLQPWPLSSDSANVTVHPSLVPHDATTSRPELTIIMQRINPNPPPSNESNTTFEASSSASTFQDAAQEALNTIRGATQPATSPADGSQDLLESTRAEPDLPVNASQCAHIIPDAHTLVSAVFANTEFTEKGPDPTAPSTPSTGDSDKPLVDMEKSTMAILQQLLDVKTTIEPLTAETNEALAAETTLSAATIEQIAAKIAESIATTIEPAAIFTQPHDSASHLSLMNFLGSDLTVRASVLQSENASRHATVDDEDLEIANVTVEEKESKSAVTSDEATTNVATEKAVVELLEKGDDTGLANIKGQESSNSTVEAIITATANVSVVDDPANDTSTVALNTTQTSSNASADATEIAQVLSIEKNSSPATVWEDLGTVLAHVTVSYKEENKIDSDLNLSLFTEDSTTETTIGRSNFSEASSSSPTTTDDVNKVAITTDSVLTEIINPNGSENSSHIKESVLVAHTNLQVNLSSSEKGGQIEDLVVSTDINVPSESTSVTLPASTSAATTSDASVTITPTSDEHTELNVLVFNFSLADSAETTSSASGIIEIMTTRPSQAQNDIRSNTIEFTTIETADTSSEESSKEVNSTSSLSALFTVLSSSSTESAMPTGLENGDAVVTMTYTTDNGHNLTGEVEKVEHIGGVMAANQSAANEQLPLETTTVVSAIKDEGDAMTNASTEQPTATSPSSPVKIDFPATEVTRISEFPVNDTSTISSSYVESVTFTNKIRLDVADQLPQSFFVESFLSPLNYSALPVETYPSNNDFPFEIFFNTNYSDSTSSSPPFNFSVPAVNFSDLNASSVNVSGDPLADNSDGSNYTKIFAQKIVVHPVKVLNSVNSVYLSPGFGFQEGTTVHSLAANSTESFTNATATATEESNSTECNSTESTTMPYEGTTVPFEDAKPSADNPWRNVSLSNYKILLDSLTDAKVRPFTKVPKVTGAPLTWLKNPMSFLGSSATNHTGALNSSTPDHGASIHLNASKIDTSSNTTTTSNQHLKNESRSESPQAKVYDPLMPYPEEYPEEYQTIQNGPAIIITRTTYTRIPDVTYTTVTMATLPTYQQVQKAEDGFAQTLFERKFRERSFPKEADSASSTTTESTNKYFNIDVKKIEDELPTKRNSSKAKSSDRRMPDPPLDNRNYIKSRISVKGVSVEKKDSKTPALDEKDLKIVQNFMNKHLRLR